MKLSLYKFHDLKEWMSLKTGIECYCFGFIFDAIHSRLDLWQNKKTPKISGSYAHLMAVECIIQRRIRNILHDDEGISIMTELLDTINDAEIAFTVAQKIELILLDFNDGKNHAIYDLFINSYVVEHELEKSDIVLTKILENEEEFQYLYLLCDIYQCFIKVFLNQNPVSILFTYRDPDSKEGFITGRVTVYRNEKVFEYPNTIKNKKFGIHR